MAYTFFTVVVNTDTKTVTSRYRNQTFTLSVPDGIADDAIAMWAKTLCRYYDTRGVFAIESNLGQEHAHLSRAILTIMPDAEILQDTLVSYGVKQAMMVDVTLILYNHLII